jgi:hypothetical protein
MLRGASGVVQLADQGSWGLWPASCCCYGVVVGVVGCIWCGSAGKVRFGCDLPHLIAVLCVCLFLVPDRLLLCRCVVVLSLLKPFSMFFSNHSLPLSTHPPLRSLGVHRRARISQTAFSFSTSSWGWSSIAMALRSTCCLRLTRTDLSTRRAHGTTLASGYDAMML